MKTLKISFAVIFSIVFICQSFAVDSSSADRTVDNRIYADLLGKYVKNGTVDYRGFKNEEVKLDLYLKILEEINPDLLSSEEQFAFYVNASWIKEYFETHLGVLSKALETFFDTVSLTVRVSQQKIKAFDGLSIEQDHEHKVDLKI